MDTNRNKKSSYSTTNLQPNALDTLKPSQGVIIKANNTELRGPEAKYDTMSKLEQKAKYKVEEPKEEKSSDNEAQKVDKHEELTAIKEGSDKLSRMESLKHSASSKQIKKDLKTINDEDD